MTTRISPDEQPPPVTTPVDPDVLDTPAETVTEFEQRLRDAGRDVTIHRYPGTGQLVGPE